MEENRGLMGIEENISPFQSRKNMLYFIMKTRKTKDGGIKMAADRHPEDMVRITDPALAEAFIEEQVTEIRTQVGNKKVLLALSGGVDSSVVAAFLIRAIGQQLV